MSFIESFPGVCFHKILRTDFEGIVPTMEQHAIWAEVLGTYVSLEVCEQKIKQTQEAATSHNKAETDLFIATERVGEVAVAANGAHINEFIDPDGEVLARKILAESIAEAKMLEELVITTNDQLPKIFKSKTHKIYGMDRK